MKTWYPDLLRPFDGDVADDADGVGHPVVPLSVQFVVDGQLLQPAVSARVEQQQGKGIRLCGLRTTIHPYLGCRLTHYEKAGPTMLRIHISSCVNGAGLYKHSAQDPSPCDGGDDILLTPASAAQRNSGPPAVTSSAAAMCRTVPDKLASTHVPVHGSVHRMVVHGQQAEQLQHMTSPASSSAAAALDAGKTASPGSGAHLIGAAATADNHVSNTQQQQLQLPAVPDIDAGDRGMAFDVVMNVLEAVGMDANIEDGVFHFLDVVLADDHKAQHFLSVRYRYLQRQVRNGNVVKVKALLEQMAADSSKSQ